MKERDAVLQIFRNRGWLSAALARALLEDPRLSGLEQLVGLEREGLLLRRQLSGGFQLFRTAARGRWQP